MADNLLDAEKSSRAGLPAIPSDYRKLLKMYVDIGKYIDKNVRQRDKSNGAEADRLQNEIHRAAGVQNFIRKALVNVRKRSLGDVVDEINGVFDDELFREYDKLTRKYGRANYKWFLNPTGDGLSSPINFINFLKDVESENEHLRVDKDKWRMAKSLKDDDLRYMVDHPGLVFSVKMSPLSEWPSPDLHEDGTYDADEYKNKVIDHYGSVFYRDMEKLLRLYGFGEGMSQELTPWQQEMLFGTGVIADPVAGPSIENWEMNPGFGKFMREFLY